MTQMIGPKLAQWLQNEFQSERLLPGLTSSLLMGISEVMFALSLGSVIFSGAPVPYLPYGIGISLFIAAVIMMAPRLPVRCRV